MPPEPQALGGVPGALAVFDLDGTITRHDTLMPFVLGCLWRHPWRLPRLLWLVPVALGFVVHRDRGRLKGALISATLGGLSRESLARWAARFVPQLLRHGLYAEALSAIAHHRAQGDRLLLMSASTDLYVPLIAQALGIPEVRCSRVRWRADGRLDGRLAGANCYGEEKRRCLQALIERDPPARIYAYGNSGSDLAHMQLAHCAYLVNGPGRLQRGADAHVQPLRWSRRGSAQA